MVRGGDAKGAGETCWARGQGRSVGMTERPPRKSGCVGSVGMTFLLCDPFYSNFSLQAARQSDHRRRATTRANRHPRGAAHAGVRYSSVDRYVYWFAPSHELRGRLDVLDACI